MTTYESQKRHAGLMRRLGPTAADRDYWTGYLIGLAGRSAHHDALLAGIGSADSGRDWRGQGYQDARAFVEEREPVARERDF